MFPSDFIVFVNSSTSGVKRENFTSLVLFILLLSIANLSEGLPNDLKAFSSPNRLVGSDSEMRKLEKEGSSSHHIRRRIASAMVPIREREMSSLCTYKVTTDVNHQRIPDKIDRVLCQKDSCKCVEQGDYKCTQLFTQLNVTYLSANLNAPFDFELINVEYACVCARTLGGSDVNLLEPILVR